MLGSPNTTERFKANSSSWNASANNIKDDGRKSVGEGGSLDSLEGHTQEKKNDYRQVIITESIRTK